MSCVVLVVLGVGACSNGTDTSAPDTTALPGVTTLAPLAERYEAATLRVFAADGTTREMCVLLAATAETRQSGLMGVTSLEGYDGMLFRFSPASTGQFWMYRTLLPLSIAFFDDGVYVSSTDMAPCPADDPGACPRYGAAAPYTEALEVTAGDLGVFGVGPGTRVEVEGPCER